jgi:YVTN family beta-propeller protein
MRQPSSWRALLVVLFCAAGPSPGSAAEPTWRLVQRAKTGSMPWGASVSPDGKWLYVTHVGNKDHDNVFRYDAATLRVEARAQFPGHAVESIVSRDGKRLFVSNSRKHELLVLDAMTLAVEARLATGRVPKDFRLSPDERLAYVADYGSDTLSVVDLRGERARQRVRVGRHPRGVATSPDGKTIYVSNNGSRTLSVVDAASLSVTTVEVCPSPRHVVVSPDGASVLVGCLGSGRLVVLDAATRKVTRRLEVGRGPKTVLVTRDGKLAISADERGNSLSMVDLGSGTTETLPLAARGPCGLALSPDERRLYVTARGSHEVLVLER